MKFNIRKDKRGMAPIVMIGVVGIVIMASFAAIALYSMSEQDPIYPAGKNESAAQGYIALQVSGTWIPPDSPDAVDVYRVHMLGTTVSAGRPTVDVFGIELPDVLEFDARSASVKMTVTYPDHTTVSDTKDVSMNYEGGPGGHWKGVCEFPPILYFENGLYHFDLEFTINGVTTTSSYDMHIPFSGQIVEAD